MSDDNSTQHDGIDPSAEGADPAAQIEQLRQQLAAAEDRALRVQAEAQNMVRRAERDVENARKFALERFAGSLLPVLDNLERALAAMAANATADCVGNATAGGNSSSTVLRVGVALLPPPNIVAALRASGVSAAELAVLVQSTMLGAPTPALAAHPALGEAHKARRWLYETIRLMLSQQVYDLIAATTAALAAHQPGSVDAVRHCPELVVFSPGMRAGSQALKAFLMAALYRHPQVMDTMDRAKQVVRDLFAAYLNDPKAMQTGSALRPVGEGAPDIPRVVADYIAGMTDRFAAREHERLTGKRLLA